MKSTRKIVTTASVLFAAAAFGGLMAGTTRAATPSIGGSIAIAGTPAPAVHNVDAHGCKGQNDCKGQGGCSSSDNGCAGKNSCKGKGGCKTTQI